MALPHPPTSLVVATLATAAYTLIVWWLCQPLVKALIRNPGRRQD